MGYPYYARSDVSFTRKSTTKRGWEKEIYIQILNVFNRANVHQYFYEEEWTNTGYPGGVTKRVIPMFPIIPTFGVSYEF